MCDESALSLVLWTTDIDALARFLAAVAGLSVEAHHPGYASLVTGGSRVMLHGDETYRGHPWYNALMREGVARGIGAELRFRVANVDESYSTALKMGGLAIQAVYDQEGVRECQVMGPDGFVFSLWQPVDASLR